MLSVCKVNLEVGHLEGHGLVRLCGNYEELPTRICLFNCLFESTHHSETWLGSSRCDLLGEVQFEEQRALSRVWVLLTRHSVARLPNLVVLTHQFCFGKGGSHFGLLTQLSLLEVRLVLFAGSVR